MDLFNIKYKHQNIEHLNHVSILFFKTLLEDSICDKNSAPSVSSISRVLRGGHTDIGLGDELKTNHSIDGILGKIFFFPFLKFVEIK